MGSRVEIYTLGGVRVSDGKEPVSDLTSRKAVALLIYLASTKRKYPREVLADLLWDDREQSQAMSNLRGVLTSLRKLLGDRLEATRAAVSLNPDGTVWLDASELEERLGAFSTQGGLTPANASTLASILAYYQGEFLEGFTVYDCQQFEQWVVRERERLHHLVVDSLSELVRFEIEQHDFKAGVAHATRLLELDPLLESAHRQMMLLLSLSGQRGAALKQYEACQKLLKEELGIAPDIETCRLYNQISEGSLEAEPARQSQLPANVIAAKNTPPTGTVTFLFTDIEGSTPLWEMMPVEMEASVALHHAILRRVIEANDGHVFQILGDAFQAAFRHPAQGLQAAVEAQRALICADWGQTGPLRVRMGLHTGPAEIDPIPGPGGIAQYAVCHTLNRSARVMSAGHGGQILLSQEAKDLIERRLPGGIVLVDLGEHRMKGMQWLEHLYQVSAPSLPQDFPPLSTAISHPNNLPAQLTSFIGREKEIADIVARLNQHRLVTLTGSGGVGKTRLAIQAVSEMLDEFPHGIWFIELAPISNPNHVSSAVATVLGLREESNTPILETLCHFLSARRLLLVLDNCEHLLQASASLADALLRQAPQIKILATSREALGITGELTFRVPSLAFPGVQRISSLLDMKEFEAVRLFVERARLSMPTFEVSEQNAEKIIAICQRLDGIPLAIELAAARLNILTTEQLASRLDHAFRLLTGGNRVDLPHHQTLRATIDWSHQLLSIPERVLLRRLSVFAGGSTLEAIEAVCSGDGIEDEQVLDLLSGLVDKSMVNPDRKQGAETRYRLLETVRQYGAEKLNEAGEYETFKDRHLDYFLALAEDTELQLRTSIAVERLHALNREVDNLRAALSWAFDQPANGRIAYGLRLASALLYFWHRQSFHFEGYTWLMKGLAPTAGIVVDPGVRAKACFSVGHLILPLGRTSEARKWEQESLALYQEIGDARGAVMAQSLLGEVYAWECSLDEASELGRASVALCRDLGDDWLLAWVICRLGTSYFYLGEQGLSAPLLEESLEIFGQTGAVLHVGDPLMLLGVIYYIQGDLSKAEVYFYRALNSACTTQSKWAEANVIAGIGFIAHEKGEFQRMRDYMAQSLEIFQETGSHSEKIIESMLGFAEIHLNHFGQARCHLLNSVPMLTNPFEIAVSLIGIARIAQENHQLNLSAQLLGACQKTIEEGQSWRFGRIGTKEFRCCWSETKMLMEETAFKQAVSFGQTMNLKQAVTVALEELSRQAV